LGRILFEEINRDLRGIVLRIVGIFRLSNTFKNYKIAKMRPSFLLSTLTLAFLLTCSFVSYAQEPSKNANDSTKNNNLKFDTSKIAIIKLNEKGSWPFNSTYQPSTLTQNELILVDSCLIACVNNYNNSLDKNHKQWSIDLNKLNYRRQLIVVTNSKGQKEVWVNCFCWINSDEWKTHMLIVDDGGNCYFNFKINLTTKRYYDLVVNGLA
jgi:hypothetical protein